MNLKDIFEADARAGDPKLNELYDFVEKMYTDLSSAGGIEARVAASYLHKVMDKIHVLNGGKSTTFQW